jgi:Icc protein
MIIVQISDPHVGAPGRLIHGCIDAAARLRRCVEHILELEPAPDVVVVSGDLVDEGVVEEYERLRELLAPLTMPVYLMPGNHDERAALRVAFRGHRYFPAEGALFYAVDTYPVRMIMLDTVVAGMDGGSLETEQLEWLSAQLAAAPDRPTVLFMHHPPLMTGIHGMDEIALDPGSISGLEALAARHPQIERIACGHVHRPLHARWCSTTVTVCPSTAYQAKVDLRGGFEPDPEELPAYHIHCWNGAELVTHTVAVRG